MSSSEKVKKWRESVKTKLVMSLGGSCFICGYNKSNRALQLHHLDPSEKEFSIGKSMRNPPSLEKIADEAEKCILLCGNCHSEYHDGLISLEGVRSNFNRNIFFPPEEIRYCEQCGKILEGYGKRFCSNSCRGKHNASKRITNENFLKVLAESDFINLKASKIIGISDVAVRKRRIKMGLPPSGNYIDM